MLKFLGVSAGVGNSPEILPGETSGCFTFSSPEEILWSSFRITLFQFYHQLFQVVMTIIRGVLAIGIVLANR